MAGFMDLFSGLLKGGASAIGKGIQSVGQGIGNVASGATNMVGQGLHNLFPGGGGNNGAVPIGAPAGGGYNTGFNRIGATATASGGSKMGEMFKSAIPGMVTMMGSQFIGNPKTPALPNSFNEFMDMTKSGPPMAQSANQYMQSILSGQNTAANDAATHSLDLNYEEQLRQLNSMYKSLRPGTDPTTDSTYQRDLQLLNDQYTRQRAQVLAQQQMGAAQAMQGAGQNQMQNMQSAIEAQLNQIATQWNMSYEQRQALRNALLGMGGNMVSGPIQMKMFQQMFGKED